MSAIAGEGPKWICSGCNQPDPDPNLRCRYCGGRCDLGVYGFRAHDERTAKHQPVKRQLEAGDIVERELKRMIATWKAERAEVELELQRALRERERLIAIVADATTRIPITGWDEA